MTTARLAPFFVLVCATTVLAGCTSDELACPRDHEARPISSTNSHIHALADRFEAFPGCYRGAIDAMSFVVAPPGEDPTEFAPKGASLSPDDGGSVSFVMLANATPGQRATLGGHAGTVPTWRIHFLEWSTTPVNGTLVTDPSIRLTWDGADADASPDALPAGEYVVRMRHGPTGQELEMSCTVPVVGLAPRDCDIDLRRSAR